MSVVALKKKQKEAFDVASVLAGATTEKKKSKSDVPEIQADKETRELCDGIRELKTEIESLTSECKIKESELIARIQADREHLLRSGYTSSLRVPDTQGLTVMVSWRDQYSAIETAKEPALRDILGDRYSSYFEKRIEITVTDVTEDGLSELINLVGPANFARFFSVTQSIRPTKRYTPEFYSAFTAEERQKLSAIAVQYSPSIKIK